MAHQLNRLRNFLDRKNYVSPWIRLNAFDFKQLTEEAALISVKKGALLFTQGAENERIYIVKEGRLRLFFVDDAGNESCIYIAEEGSIIGEISAIDARQNLASAYAITDVSLYCVSLSCFRRIVAENAELSLNIMKALCQKIRVINSRTEYFSKDALSRVAISLIFLCVEYGEERENGIRIAIRFTHEELSNLTNLNRVTVSKIYRKLSDDGIIISSSKFITVADADKLMSIVERPARSCE